jgi:hypothetical protein
LPIGESSFTQREPPTRCPPLCQRASAVRKQHGSGHRRAAGRLLDGQAGRGDPPPRGLRQLPSHLSWQGERPGAGDAGGWFGAGGGGGEGGLQQHREGSACLDIHTWPSKTFRGGVPTATGDADPTRVCGGVGEAAWRHAASRILRGGGPPSASEGSADSLGARSLSGRRPICAWPCQAACADRDELSRRRFRRRFGVTARRRVAADASCEDDSCLDAGVSCIYTQGVAPGFRTKGNALQR